MRMLDIYSYSMSTKMVEDIGWKERDNISSLYKIETNDNPNTLVYFVTGSGCISLKAHMPAYLRDLNRNFVFYGLEKTGVKPGATGLHCDLVFYQHNDFQTLYTRNFDALSYLINSSEVKFNKIVIIGVSEGAVIASKLASKISKIDKVVLIGSGGMPQRQSLKILAEKHHVDIPLELIEQKIAEDPNALDLIYGQTVKYWSSFLDEEPASYIKNSKSEFLIIMGDHDQSEPIESFYDLRNKTKHLPNIYYKIIEGADHVLIRNGKDLKPKIMKQIAQWIEIGVFE